MDPQTFKFGWLISLSHLDKSIWLVITFHIEVKKFIQLLDLGIIIDWQNSKMASYLDSFKITDMNHYLNRYLQRWWCNWTRPNLFWYLGPNRMGGVSCGRSQTSFPMFWRINYKMIKGRDPPFTYIVVILFLF